MSTSFGHAAARSTTRGRPFQGRRLRIRRRQDPEDPRTPKRRPREATQAAPGSPALAGAVRGIDHVGLTVPDIEAATRFFVEAFDAVVLYSPLPKGSPPRYGAFMEQRLGVPARTLQHTIRMLKLPHGPGLELFEFSHESQRRPVTPIDFGWQHVAFYVDDIHAALARVVAAGGEALTQPNPLSGVESGPGNYFVYCHAPWGSTIELISYPDPQPYEEFCPRRRWRP